MNNKIPTVNLQLQYEAIREEINAAIRRVLKRQDFILGPEVSRLEQAVARAHDCSYGIGCASGSDALLLSLLALGVGRGDEVIVPSFTFFATAGSVARTGAKPLFADIDPRTFNLSPPAVAEVLAKKKHSGKVKAILPVHLYGQCADMDALLELAGQHGLFVVEDAAQAILARYQGRAAGSMGICGGFSFFPTKNLGGFGDGGLITTNDGLLAARLRALGTHGAMEKNVHTCLGTNSRLDTLQAAILLAKLRHLKQWTNLRQQKASFYHTAFLEAGLADPAATYPSGDYPVVLPYQAPRVDPVFHQFTLRVARRDELSQHLASKGIETAVYYPRPLHRQPAFSYVKVRPGNCSESERAANEVLSIPIYPELSERQQVRIVQEITKFYTV